MLLNWKEPLHAFVGKMSKSDIRAIYQLVLIALVILPVLPNESFGPYGVLNPFEIWLMVVLIVGISVGSFIGYKLFGAKAGTLLGGALGGLISSTATTVGYSRRSGRHPRFGAAALVILIASTVVFGRVLVEIALVAPQILAVVAPPLLVMTGLMAVIIMGMLGNLQKETDQVPVGEGPSELKAAIVFGLLYAGVLFAVAVAKEHFGDQPSTSSPVFRD